MAQGYGRNLAINDDGGQPTVAEVAKEHTAGLDTATTRATEPTRSEAWNEHLKAAQAQYPILKEANSDYARGRLPVATLTAGKRFKNKSAALNRQNSF